MDLANLGFVVETQSIKDGIEALRQLQAAALGVTKTFKEAEVGAENLGKTTEESEDKAGKATEQSTRRRRKTQDDYLTFLSEALDKSLARELQAQQKKEQAQKASAQAASRTIEQAASIEQGSIDRTIKKLEIKKQEIAAGARSSEATAVAIARLNGATDKQIETIRTLMREINTFGGKNPFDSVVGEFRRISDEARALQAIIDASNNKIGLTSKELMEVASISEKIRSIGKDVGATQEEINKFTEFATTQYKEQVRQLNLLKEQTDDIREAERLVAQTASANKRVQEQITAELKKQELIKEGFSKRDAGFIVTSVGNGVSKADAIALLAAEKATEDLANSNKTLAGTSKEVTVAYDAQVRAYEKNQDSVQRNLEATRKKLEQVKIEASLAAQGLSRTTAVGVANLQQRGASEADVQTYIRTRKEIEKITAEARKAGLATQGLSTILRQISPAVGAVGVVAVLTQIGVAAIRTADSLTLLQNKLTVMTSGTADFNVEFANLLRIANESRSSVADIGTLYSRLIPVVEKLGGGTKEAAAVTEAFSKLLLIGGTNTREASAAIVQFSQALGKGKLDGDEFRSIAEATPEVLRLLEDSLGKTRGELYEMSAAGQLTAEVLGNTLIGALDGLDAKLLGLPLTTGQAFQVLLNNLTDSVRLFEQGTSTAGGLAEMIQGLATGVYDLNRAFESGEYDSILSSLQALNVVLGAVTVSVLGTRLAIASLTGVYALFTGATEGASSATKVFNFVLGANPIVRVVTVLGTLIGSMYLLKDVTFELGGELTDLGSLTEAVFGSFGDSILSVLPSLDSLKGTFGSVFDFFANILNSNIEYAKNFWNKFIGFVVGASAVISNFWNGFGQAASQAFDDVAGLSSAFFSDLFSGDFSFASFNAKLGNSFKASFGLVQTSVEDFRQAMKKDYIGGLQEDIRLGIEQIGFDANQIKLKKDADKLVDDLFKQNERIAKQEEDAKKRKEELVRLTSGSVEPSKKATAALQKEAKAAREAAEAYASLGYEELFKQRDKNLESILKSVESTEEEIKRIEEQTDALSLSKEELYAKELATIDAAIATAEFALTEEMAKNETTGLTFALQEQIDVLNRLKQAKGKNAVAEADKDAKEKAKKAAEDTQKEFEKIQDDIAKAVGDAIIQGGQKGKDILKNMFKAQIFRIFIEPVIRGGLGTIGAALGVPGSTPNDPSSLSGSLLGFGTQSSSSGFASQFLNFGNNLSMSDAPEFLKSFGDDIANNSELLGQVAAGLGALTTGLSAFDSLKDGRYATAIGEGVGYYFGGSVGAAIGKSIGSFVDKTFGIGGKVSAQSLDPSFGANIVQTLDKQYADIVKTLGGVAANISFAAGGNTGRQGQNPNFQINASANGSSIFNSRDTAEGQADGLFLQGEIALNEANLLDQSTRALVAVLQNTRFDQNIADVFAGVNAASSSLEELNVALSDAQLLKTVNVEFKKLGGSLATLSGASIQTVKTFITLAGGVENLANLQSGYIESIYSEEEKLQLRTKNLKTAFDALGISVPKTTKEFKDLTEAQNLTTVKGQATYLALLQLAPAFKEVTDATKAATEALEKESSAITKTIEATAFKIRSSFQNLIFGIQSRANTLSLGSFETVVTDVQDALNGLNTKPFVDFTKNISKTVPTDSAYRNFIKEIGKQQPSAGSYLNFVDAIEGFTPSTAAYKSFADAVSGVKPTTVAYREFVKSVQGLKPSDELYKAFVASVSLAKPKVDSFGKFIAEIQAKADAVRTNKVNTAIGNLSDQIDVLKTTVNSVDVSAFILEMTGLTTDISNLTNKLSSTTDPAARLLIEKDLTDAISKRYELEQNLLNGVLDTISDVLASVRDERVAVRESAIDILGGRAVMTPSKIESSIKAVKDSINFPDLEALDARIETATNTLERAKNTINNADKRLESNIDRATNDVYDRQFFDSIQKQFNIANNAEVLTKNLANKIGVALKETNIFFTNSEGKGVNNFKGVTGSAQDKATFNEAFKNEERQIGGLTTTLFDAMFKVNDRVNALKVKAEQELAEEIKKITEKSATDVERAKAVVIAQEKILADLDAKKVEIQADYVKTLQEFVIDAGKAVSKLGKLREETVRYFQEQQRLAEALTSSSQGIRQTIADIAFADLNPQGQLNALKAQFASVFATANLAEGDALAQAGGTLNSLINPLLQKAQEVFGSSTAFQELKESILKQAGDVATRIEELTPVDYQKESLDLLDTIDTTLALIENNTKSAEQLIVDAIGKSATDTIAALGQIYKGITGVDIPAFAAGGNHFGGTALVGEQGPEIVNMGNARVFNASQTASMLGGSKVDMKPVVEVLQRVQERTEFQIRVLQEGFKQMDERQSAMQEELQDIRKKGNLERQKQTA